MKTRLLLLLGALAALAVLQARTPHVDRPDVDARAVAEREIQRAFDETSYQGNRDSATRRFWPGYAESERVLNVDAFVGDQWDVERSVDHDAHWKRQLQLMGR